MSFIKIQAGPNLLTPPGRQGGPFGLVWRPAAAAAGLLGCCLGTWAAGRAGYSRLLSNAVPLHETYISSDADSAGAASFKFEVPAPGRYVIWCRVLARMQRTDSFYVSVDGGPEDIYDVAQGVWSKAWQWTQVNGRSGGAPLTVNPRVFNLSAGAHTLVFRARERGALLSRMVVTNDLEFMPAEDDRPWAALAAGGPPLTYLAIEAGDGALTPPMEIHAAGGRGGDLLALADEPVRLAPADPEAHAARAHELSESGREAEAVKEFQAAAALRPRDYGLWLELGRASEQAGMTEEPLAAFRRAVQLAPYYALPRWRLGRLLLRAGRRDEAFAELRRAAESDPSLLTKVIHLAWAAYERDAGDVRRVIRPQSTQSSLALARFFMRENRVSEAADLFRSLGSSAEPERRAWLAELLAAKRFREAHEVWASAGGAGGGADRAGAELLNGGGFEGGVSLDDPGFGWKAKSADPSVRVSLDIHDPQAGARSLLLEFNGGSDPATRLVSQLALVEAGERYRLSFAARTEGVVTGGTPVVTVTDAGSDGRALGQSPPIPEGTTPWRAYAVDLTTPEATEAVLVAVRRQNCAGMPCPIFGRVWFDAFSLQRLPPGQPIAPRIRRGANSAITTGGAAPEFSRQPVVVGKAGHAHG